jgi:coenzyme F420-reducing hydrogenase delta subunit/Pyruvate/2-oxoacid:ferredoxin oxidoreductase delta subunit
VHLPVVGARPAPPARGQRLLDALERPFLALDRVVQKAIPEHLNPFTQTGAVANTAFLIACVTGILLLFWYVPSVHQAYSSVEAMGDQPLTAGLLRSLHRYSSDGCMLFVALHALRYLAGTKVGGARWLAWVTGLGSLGLLWLIGWLGYWLVWDQRAQSVAVGTAKLLDGLPIFVDPLSRSFLSDATVNSLLFFVVFFLHMLIPLGMGIVLWLHITRLSRPRFLANAPLTLWMMASLVLLSLVWPATSAEPARMTEPAASYTMDWWYLLPVALTDRLGGGALWALVLGVGAVLFGAPWWMFRGRAPVAKVEQARCNACERCVADCPYGAIEMAPRTDDRRYAAQARVNPSRCVGCGICAGSCDSAGIGIPWLSVTDVRARMDAFVDRAAKGGDAPHIAFLCADSAAAGLRIDPATGACDALPGYLCWAVPCAGWVHALTVERAIRHGAAGVLVVACGEGECAFREGALWTEDRLAGRREPRLREKVDRERVRVLRVSKGEGRALTEGARAFLEGRPVPTAARPRRPAQVAAGLAVAAVLTALTAVASDLPYRSPVTEGAVLTVSFKHAGAAGEQCRELTEEEQARMPVHMRRDRVCERGRASVRLRVLVDGHTLHEQTYAPRGLFGDGSSTAVERLEVTPGTRTVTVALGETSDPNEWTYVFERRMELTGGAHRLVTFDRGAGFRFE